MTPKAQSISKKKIDKRSIIKILKFFSVKETVKRIKR